jgi:toxin-antitoxin system, toxin component, fic family
MNKEIERTHGEIVIYTADDGNTKIDVNFIDETVWLSQQQMAELFKTSRTNIVEHIGNIYDEGELDKI